MNLGAIFYHLLIEAKICDCITTATLKLDQVWRWCTHTRLVDSYDELKGLMISRISFGTKLEQEQSRGNEERIQMSHLLLMIEKTSRSPMAI